MTSPCYGQQGEEHVRQMKEHKKAQVRKTAPIKNHDYKLEA